MEIMELYGNINFSKNKIFLKKYFLRITKYEKIFFIF